MSTRPPRSTAMRRRRFDAAPTADGAPLVVFDGLTADELHALDLTAELYNLICRIAGTSGSRAGDLQEAASAIHVIQNMLLAQAAARAYPGRFRLLGRSLR